MKTFIALAAYSVCVLIGCSPPPTYSGRPLDEWTAQMTDSNPLFRIEAISAIGEIALRNGYGQRLIPVLATALNDNNPQVRDNAALQIVSVGASSNINCPDALRCLLSETAFASNHDVNDLLKLIEPLIVSLEACGKRDLPAIAC